MSEAYIGEIRMFAGNFAPRNWAFCNGQILAISQNTALFSILGTTYGGNGTSTFALPNLQARSPVGVGQGNGLSYYTQGDSGGVETVTLSQTQIPAHSHTVGCVTGATGVGTQVSPANGILAIPGAARGLKAYNSTAGSSTAMNAAAVSLAGSYLPHNNMPPFLAINYIICTGGIYPSRN